MTIHENAVPERVRAERGFSIVEVMVASSILAVAVLGLGLASLKLTKSNDYTQDRSIAQQAAQEMIEFLSTETTASVWSYNGTTATVNGLYMVDGANALSVTVSDLGWDSTPGQKKALLIAVDVTIDNRNYAHLQSIRTSY